MIPSPTSQAISPGVSIIATCPSVGSRTFGGGHSIGSLYSYRSLSTLASGGGGVGGRAGLRGALVGHPPPFPPAVAPWGMYGTGVQGRNVPSLSPAMLASHIGTGAMGGVPRLIGSCGVGVAGRAICTATL